MGPASMKYMGSKRVMLRSGLGEAILKEALGKERVVDLFSGSGAVAWFAAENLSLPVIAVDLQDYAVVLARSVVEQAITLDYAALADRWLGRVHAARRMSRLWALSMRVQENE